MGGSETDFVLMFVWVFKNKKNEKYKNAVIRVKSTRVRPELHCNRPSVTQIYKLFLFTFLCQCSAWVFLSFCMGASSEVRMQLRRNSAVSSV